MYLDAPLAMRRHEGCSFLTGASGGPPDGARVVHHLTDELLMQQNLVSDGENTPPV